MSLDDCPHEGARHGRFSIVTRRCEGCDRQWELRGCLAGTARETGETLRETRVFRQRCACGTEVRVPLPSFVGELTVRAIRPARLPLPPPESTQPAA